MKIWPIKKALTSNMRKVDAIVSLVDFSFFFTCKSSRRMTGNDITDTKKEMTKATV